MPERNYYLSDLPLKDARQRWQAGLERAGLDGLLSAETVPIGEALGRVTARACFAQGSVPHYHAAAMDGFAIRSEATQGVNDRNPVTLSVGQQAAPVDTGDPIPEWADAVVPIEHVEAIGETSASGEPLESVRLRQALTPWQHVRPMGEDMVATELVLPAGHQLRPVDLGALASAGHHQVEVAGKPRVAILPTGDELVPPGQPPDPGQIIESNSLVMAGQVEEWGGQADILPPVPDDLEAIEAAVSQAASENDLILILAGSSAGSEDFTAQVVDKLGELMVHGIAVRPGHPVILGMLEPAGSGRPTPVIGVPGYPVSAALTGEIFLEPLLARWMGRQPELPVRRTATIGRKVHSSLGDDEYVRVTLARIDDELVAQPLSRGAGVISSLVRADGLLVIPAGVQGHSAGERVAVNLYRPEADIERNLMVQGSHDLTLDLMSQFLGRSGVRLTSSNVGSLGGLIALAKGYSHLAGSHLLDPASGEYNVAFVQEYLPDQEILIVALVEREQGLIVPPDNPKELRGLADLVQPGIRFVNRQRGAGTRQLLDYQLAEQGIESARIQGYEREEYTHLAVAAAVQSGTAYCGLGIRAAASALGLDFIALYQERYDLIVPRRLFESERFKPVRGLMADPEFQKRVAELPGYGVKPMGRIIAELPAD